MNLILSLLFSFIPVLIYLIILWWLDRYEREPIKNIMFHFLWGMFGAVTLTLIFSSIIESYASSKIKDEFTLSYLSTVLVAPLIEELFKGLILILTFSKIKFDNLTDGIVYGGSVGLGFGLTENFLYFYFYTDNIKDLILLALFRNAFSVTIHFVASAVLGSILAMAKFKNSFKKTFIFLYGFILAVLIHGLFNLSVISGDGFFLSIAFVVISFIMVMILLFISLSYEQNILINELTDEVIQGHLKHHYAQIIPYTNLRNMKGWINEKHRKNLISYATTLAFRKNQMRKIKSEKIKNIYQNEIEFLRTKINNITNENE